MTAEQRVELTTLLRQTIADEAAINAWLDEFPMTKHPEARLVYFLGHLLATGNDDGFFPAGVGK
jgi:hypothetical protein